MVTTIETKPMQSELENISSAIEEKANKVIDLCCQRKRNRFLEDLEIISKQLEPIYQAKVSECGELIAKAWIGGLSQKSEWQNLNDLIELFPVHQKFIILPEKEQNLFLDRACFFSNKFLNKIVALYPLAREKFLQNLGTTEEKKASALIKEYQIGKFYENEEMSELHWEAVFHKFKDKKAGRKKDAPVMNLELFEEIKQYTCDSVKEETILTNHVQTGLANWGFKLKLADKNATKKKAPSVTEKYKKAQEALAKAERQIAEKEEIIQKKEIEYKKEIESIHQYYAKKLETIHQEIEQSLLSNGDFIKSLTEKVNSSAKNLTVSASASPEENVFNRQIKEDTPLQDNQIVPEMKAKVIAAGNCQNQVGVITGRDDFTQKWWVHLDREKNDGSNTKHQFLASELAAISKAYLASEGAQGDPKTPPQTVTTTVISTQVA